MYDMSEILKESSADLIIDKSNLKHEVIKCSILIHKYLTYHQTIVRQMISLNSSKDKLTRMLWFYYSGKATSAHLKHLNEIKPFNHVLEKRDLDKFIKSNEKYTRLNDAIESVKEDMKVIEGIIDTLKYMPNAIKTSIDYEKFLSGE